VTSWQTEQQNAPNFAAQDFNTKTTISQLIHVFTKTATTTHLTALYPKRPGWAGTRNTFTDWHPVFVVITQHH